MQEILLHFFILNSTIARHPLMHSPHRVCSCESKNTRWSWYLAFPLPIHLYKHQNMIYLCNSSCTFLNCIKTYCLRLVWFCMDSLWGWHFEPNHALWFVHHFNRFIYVAHFSVSNYVQNYFYWLKFSYVYFVIIWIINWPEPIRFCKFKKLA